MIERNILAERASWWNDIYDGIFQRMSKYSYIAQMSCTVDLPRNKITLRLQMGDSLMPIEAMKPFMNEQYQNEAQPGVYNEGYWRTNVIQWGLNDSGHAEHIRVVSQRVTVWVAQQFDQPRAMEFDMEFV